MARYTEINYDVPLNPPLPNQAWQAESDSDWRVVVFPGTPARKYLFERFLRTAPEHLDVVLLARPGFGRGHDRPYLSFEDQIAAARPFLETDKNVVTMGVSYGGELALKAAVDFPDTVKGVVPVAALINEPRDWVLPFVDLGGAPVIRSLLPRTLHHSRAEVAGRRAQVEVLFPRLKELRVPVTILHGDVDHLVAFDDAQTLKNYFAEDADVRLEKVRGGLHFLEAQMPNRVYQTIEDVIVRAERSIEFKNSA
ncbi:MAG: alpha/beta fold hydrolase [Pseudomonadota bacterium]